MAKSVSRCCCGGITIILLVCLFLGASSYTNQSFGMKNPLPFGLGLVHIYGVGVPYFVMQKSPKVIIANPENSEKTFDDYLKENSYTLVSQMGSLFVIEKDGQQERVRRGVNEFYARWVWEE